MKYRYFRGRLFDTTRGRWVRILSFCLNDPEQGPVVELPIVAIGGRDA